MGLDVVELVLRVEEEFSVDLPDSELETATTVGRLFELVVTRLKASQSDDGCYRIGEGSRGYSRRELWEKIAWICSDQLQISLEEITPEARFREDLGAD